MSITHIRALHKVDPGQARELIIKAFEEARGNAGIAAKNLGCTYQTLRRIWKSDSVLSEEIYSLKDELEHAGITQRGWGGSQKESLSKSF